MITRKVSRGPVILVGDARLSRAATCVLGMSTRWLRSTLWRLGESERRVVVKLLAGELERWLLEESE